MNAYDVFVVMVLTRILHFTVQNKLKPNLLTQLTRLKLNSDSKHGIINSQDH